MIMMVHWHFVGLFTFLCWSSEPFTLGVSAAAAAIPEVFIATAPPTKKQNRRKDVGSISMVNTATDAAMAVNSIEFMEMLSNSKNTADVKTYTQPLMKEQPNDTDSAASTEQYGQSSNSGSLFALSRWFSRENSTKSSSSEDGSSSPVCFEKQSCVTHETVTEYVGRLWFLSDKKGLRFKETIRVLSIDDDGQSSTVACVTQYHNGSEWVNCSKVVCKFILVGLKIKMKLDSEVLVRLPLPRIAANAVGKKISSVFEMVALDYFKELALS